MPDSVLQAAAIPVRGNKVCLVTSRSGRRWVFPKGRIESGQSAAQAALNEAWEEAGLIGSIDEEPLGKYYYRKLNRRYRVSVFVLIVEEELGRWPESRQREREWVTLETAMRRIEEPDLLAILMELQVQLDTNPSAPNL